MTTLSGMLALTSARNTEETYCREEIRDCPGAVVNVHAVRHGEDVQRVAAASRTFVSFTTPGYVDG